MITEEKVKEILKQHKRYYNRARVAGDFIACLAFISVIMTLEKVLDIPSENTGDKLFKEI